MKGMKKVVSILLTVIFIIPGISTLSYNYEQGTGEFYTKVLNKNKFNVEKWVQDNDAYIPKEAQDKMEILNNELSLKPMTSYKYEVAIAYSNGDYEYVCGTDDLDEAIQKTNNIKFVNEGEKSLVGAVIDSYGNVIYSPGGVGRIRKYIDGELDTTNKNVTDVYESSNLEVKSTYINHLYIDDVAIIDQDGDNVKIQFAGATGWVAGANSSGNYDIVIVPITQYLNPSYYYVENGILYHFISQDIQSVNKVGNSVSVGVAPSYLVQGKQYMSFDGIHFYDIINNGQAYENLITDLKSNSKNNAVNKTEGYYSYFNYLPFRTKTVYTVEQLNEFIDENTKDKPTSKLKGIGKALKDCEEKYGINALLTLGVAINESAWGTSKIAQEKNNLFGINAVDSNPAGAANAFKTVEDCVMDFTKNYISKGYCDPNDWRGNGAILGNKNVGVNVRYASDPFWGEKAASLAFRVDYNISDKDIRNLNDYNNYQLLMVTGENVIYNEKNETLYSVAEKKVTSKGTLKKGIVVALSNLGVVNNAGKEVYKINPDRTDKITNINITGEYNFNVKGYLSTRNTMYINKVRGGSTVYGKEDLNSDGIVDIQDLTLIAQYYNVSSESELWNSSYDLNKDEIIDIYDFVEISNKIK